jgi:hypothetical protein
MSFYAKLQFFIKRQYTLLLVIALVCAILLRFVNLGATTLTDSEAQQALQALNMANGQSTIVGGQPGYVGLTSALFFIFRGSDFFARFWPALFGACLVLVPFLFRKYFNDTVVMVLAFLIALEPGLVALSRSADGTMITITALLAAIGFFLNKKMVPAGILVGLSLIGSEKFWPLAIMISAVWLLLYVPIDIKATQIKTGAKKGWWALALSAATTVVLISTQFFLEPNAISGIGTGLVDWLRSWQQTGTMTISTFLLTLLTTQFPAIIIGIWAIVNGIKNKSKQTSFLALLWGIGLILGLVNPSHNAWTIVIMNLPLFVLVAMQINTFLEGFVFQSIIVTLIECVVTISLFFFSILNFLNMINYPPTDSIMLRNRLIGTLLPLALWITFTLLMAWGWNVVSTKSGLLIGVGLMFFALLVGSGWKAAGFGSKPENEILDNSGYIFGENDLLQTMTDVARWNNGVATSIDVDVVGLDSPSLMWLLRDFDTVTVNSTFPVTTTPSIVISGVESMIQTQALYRGQLMVWSIQPDYSQMVWQDWVKWVFARNVPQNKEKILLWVRNDLFKDQQ